MADLIIVLLIVIMVLLWRSNSQSGKRLNKLIEVIETQNKMTDDHAGATNKDYLHLILRRIDDIYDCTTQVLSLATTENPAGNNFYEYVRADNLASLYADFLERNQHLPNNLALKRARFEVAKFGQGVVVKQINSDFKSGVQQQREQNACMEFFSSGIIEKDIISRSEKIIPYTLFAPLYDLIVIQGYSGEKDFAAELSNYSVKTYDEMVNRATIIFKLEQLGILIRTSGVNWGDFLTFKLKSTDTSELKYLIYSGGSSHDNDYFKERFKEGDIPRIFDAHHIRLIFMKNNEDKT